MVEIGLALAMMHVGAASFFSMLIVTKIYVFKSFFKILSLLSALL